MSPPLTTATLLGTPGVVGVYNMTMDCSYFRSDASRGFFKVWPETNYTHCCEDTTNHLYSLSNFTYGQYGARLISRPYYDLGYVDFLLSPYWKQWRFWQVPQRKVILEGFNCEYTDLHELYNHRFWTKVMKNGAITASVIIVLMQIAVLFFVLIKWGVQAWRACPADKADGKKPAFCRADLRRWWITSPRLEDWVSDVIHIFLVVIVGGCLIEGVGHSSPIRWRPIILYNAAVVYTWLTGLCFASTILRQCTVCWFDEDEQEDERTASKLLKRLKHDIKQPPPPSKFPRARPTVLKEERSLARISEDWRWQRVFGQLAVLILIGTYLMFVDDDSGSAMDNIAALLFAALVVACMWSGGVGVVVTCRTAIHILRHVMGFWKEPPTAKEKQEDETIIETSMRFLNPALYVSGGYLPNFNQGPALYPPPHAPYINGNGTANANANARLYQPATHQRNGHLPHGQP